jgi:hypothetical protein
VNWAFDQVVEHLRQAVWIAEDHTESGACTLKLMPLFLSPARLRGVGHAGAVGGRCEDRSPDSMRPR